MKILKKLVVGLLATVLSFSLVGLVWSHIALATIYNRGTIKGWLRDSGAYDKIADIVLDSSRQNVNKEGADDPLTSIPELQQVAADSFRPAFIQESVESMFDGLYDWFEGKTDRLEFLIDLAPAKTALADGIGNYVRERAAGLPACTNKSADSFDVINSTCLPLGLTATEAGAQAKADILTNPEFFSGSTSLSSENIKISGEGQQHGLSDDETLNKIKTAYPKIKFAPLVLVVLSLLMAAGVIFLNETRRKGLRKVGFVLISSGIFIGLSYLAATRGVSFVQAKLSEQSDATESARELGSNLLGLVGSDIRGLLGLYAIGFLLTGVALIVACHFVKQDPKPEPKDESAKTDTPNKSEEAKEPEQDTKEPPKVQ